MIQKLIQYKNQILSVLVFLLLLGGIWGLDYLKSQNLNELGQSEDMVGGAEQAQWFMFSSFQGFATKADASKIRDGENPNGQNSVINDGDRVSIRDFGFTLFGQASTTQSQIKSLHTFRRRDGENVMMRNHGTFLEYYEKGNSIWESLTTTSTADQIYDYADYNINTDLRSLTYFGNGQDAFSRWSGAHLLIGDEGVTSTAGFVMTDTTTGIGFPDSGDIIYCGIRIPYSEVTATGFEVVSAHVCVADKGLAEAPEEYPSIDFPRGNIYLVANNRLFISGQATTSQAVFFSAYGDALDFAGASIITASTVASPGIFNLGEGGGPVTGLAMDENATYIFKRSVIYKATLDGDGIYTLTPLKPFDGRSQTTGAETNQSVFTGGNGVFFITPDKQIMDLTRVEQIDFPQVVAISDIIKPTVQAGNYASSSGIFFQDAAYISFKSTSDVANNDAVFIWNEKVGAWESPIIGWNASIFTVYDDGTGESLYFGSSLIAEVYEVTDGAIDNGLGISANWRSKRFDFGEPQHLKELSNFYIEGYISDNTDLTISLLFDENGDTQIYTTEFSGTEEDYIFDAPVFNMFGFSPFGTERFGSSDATENSKFRIYLNKNLRRVPFYNLQVELASDGVGQSWEAINYGFEIRRSTQPEDGSLYRAF